MKREGPTRRLFALLLDPDVVETQAIGEVHEDLAVLGIDPSEAVAIAERLAACAPSPAVKLLARLAESDLEVDEGQGWSAPDHRLRQARPPNVPRPAMISDDANIRFCATVMIAHFGEEAAKAAAATADRYLVAGNTEEHLSWLRIVKAIDELQKMQPNEMQKTQSGLK